MPSDELWRQVEAVRLESRLLCQKAQQARARAARVVWLVSAGGLVEEVPRGARGEPGGRPAPLAPLEGEDGDVSESRPALSRASGGELRSSRWF
jgi:hypothetical protein